MVIAGAEDAGGAGVAGDTPLPPPHAQSTTEVTSPSAQEA